MRIAKLLLIAAALVAVPLIALALLAARLSAHPEIRLNQVLCIPGEGSGTSSDEYLRALSRAARLTGKTWMAEFQFQVPSGSSIWLDDQPIGVEVLGPSGHWTHRSRQEPPTAAHARPARTVSKTMWLSLPPGAKSCRFTVGFRAETTQEFGVRVLSKSGVTRRFPAISGYITKHLPTTVHWRAYRRQVPMTTSVIKLEASAR